MYGHVGRQMISVVPTLLAIVVLVFLLIRLIPGDPALAILGPYATTDSIAELRQTLKLDKPIHVQLLSYLGQVAQGDLGTSLSRRRPVSHEIWSAAPHTIALAVGSTLVSVMLGVPVGIISALGRNRWYDTISRIICLIGVSAPVFVSGIGMMLVFSIRLRLFPVTGAGNWNQPLTALHHLVLPAVTVGLFTAALTMRLTRSAMLEILNEDYIRTARAKGLPQRTVSIKHALKNAAIPIVTTIGLNMGQLLGGAVVIESLFSRPGLGRLLIDGIMMRDYPVVQGVTLVFATGVVVINILVDIAYSALDPRIRYE